MRERVRIWILHNIAISSIDVGEFDYFTILNRDNFKITTI